MLYRVHLARAGFELTISVVIGNYHAITTTTAPIFFKTKLISQYSNKMWVAQYNAIWRWFSCVIEFRGRRDRDRIVGGYITTYEIRAYHLKNKLQICRGRLKKKNVLAFWASKIFEQLAPSKFDWPEKYRSTSWTDMTGGICNPPKRKLKIEQYEPH